jgi:spore germination protein GerM
MADLITDPQKARRLARAIVSDVNLYNADKVKQGIENDNLFEVIEDELEEGRELYRSRVAPEIVEKYNFYDLAVVDMLFRFSGKYKSKIW